MDAAGESAIMVDTSNFGGWEAHTRGIGSKLMLKMGYEYGKGNDNSPPIMFKNVEEHFSSFVIHLGYCLFISFSSSLLFCFLRVGEKERRSSGARHGSGVTQRKVSG